MITRPVRVPFGPEVGDTCDTFNIETGRCGELASHRLTHVTTGTIVLACEYHTSRWMRTKRSRGQVVRVHPYIVAEELGQEGERR